MNTEGQIVQLIRKSCRGQTIYKLLFRESFWVLEAFGVSKRQVGGLPLMMSCVIEVGVELAWVVGWAGTGFELGPPAAV